MPNNQLKWWYIPESDSYLHATEDNVSSLEADGGVEELDEDQVPIDVRMATINNKR